MKKLILLLAVMVMLAGCVPHSTDSTEVGVRTIKFSFLGKKGVEEKYYAPGSTYFFMPFINDWHTFDTKLQNLEMTYDANKDDRRNRDDLLFKTIDGNDISLDVIIVYKIDPAKAPYILQNVAKDDMDLRQRIVRTIARSKPRDIFGELTTEEFYVAASRGDQARKTKEYLQKMFNPMGIVIEKVLTKDYRFNPKYQKAIEDKKVADQLVEKNKSAQHAAQEEYIRKLEEARGEVNGMIADVDGEFMKSKIEADVYHEKQQLLAQAIKAEGEAQAKGIQEMNNAMASAGGEALVKLKIAEALQGKKLILLPVSEGGMNLKTTNINELIRTMGVKKLAE
ncbi:prohibitin family protein [Desulfobacter hydrogenophilus]|uniref:Prohibitin family protein n=1 Tax=Desulfobacter hydrogenophilus TaxID=2291 RepID=A0A328FDQ7_9BACT|nr:SPFH domain-containing protein [Desulfobacter hydrogenophilus]NDY71257.1 prohibitin family protein [Desulfobacter hydrogenophilus]QBH15005.1 prohibitin family protein [Desulfobacter hydrogenophilus]RAM02748.1 prohibitin family protein [Desulfobacter hydrogenophilus]